MSSSMFTFTRRGLIAAAGLPSAQHRVDNSCGTSASDSSGNGKTMSLTGGAAWTSGHACGAVYLGGNNSRKQLQVYGNKCLDAYGAGTTNGTQVVIWDCHSGTNQQWNLNSNGTITGVQSGLCLDANGAGTANGAKVILWSCHGAANQQWSQRS